ncbi:L,D-transpeptidase family protein [Zooshikella sp. RANM57]|uniref:L,D-transpeptidase family protein n=1 Tax=Zooshikella sp. RANM57 TaxID=3425863 RepID=UPI003D70042E
MPAMPRIEVCVGHQQLMFFNASNDMPTCYSISTAEKGVGQQQNSGQTPLGKHYIRAKIGDECPINAVFVGRRFTGEIYSPQLAKQYPNRDWILSRILWLCGCEKGVNRLGNVDTMRRYIYIHGTPDTEPMGVPYSHGCIRMRNQDLIELFNATPVGTPVLIKR